MSASRLNKCSLKPTWHFFVPFPNDRWLRLLALILILRFFKGEKYLWLSRNNDVEELMPQRNSHKELYLPLTQDTGEKISTCQLAYSHLHVPINKRDYFPQLLQQRSGGAGGWCGGGGTWRLHLLMRRNDFRLAHSQVSEL